MPRISFAQSYTYLFLLLLLLLTLTSISTAQKEDVRHLFSSSQEYTILGPSTFPKPSDAVSEDAVVVLKPTFGKHRAEQDAVLAYAEGYDLVNYLIFIETLRQTGFDGDIVLAIAVLEHCKAGVVDYLRAQDHVVVYAINFTCSTDKFQTITERVQDNGNQMSFQMCKLNGIYGVLDVNVTGGVRAVDDPRIGRVVATSRYELYWIWSLQYNSHSWLMLLDSRDSYFQSNPFANLKRTIDTNVKNGVLHFFGENTNSTRLGKSPKNRKWLERGYGQHVFELLADKPTICSGSTMGERVALEAYLRALVNEWDERKIHMKGSDQGFHNYLYYTNKLRNVEQIRSIEVFQQGQGVINNLGAMRNKKLTELGIFDISGNHTILEWDGTPSPVVHQWDRDRDLFEWMENRWKKQHLKEYTARIDKARTVDKNR